MKTLAKKAVIGALAIVSLYYLSRFLVHADSYTWNQRLTVNGPGFTGGWFVQ